jgi:hypothetical protein
MVSWLGIAVKVLMLFGMLIGLAGMIVPIFPGVTVIWALALLYGIVFGFGGGGGWLFAVITVLTVIGWIVDNVIMGGKARQGGARWTSIALAFVAGFIGSIFLTPLGGIAATLGALYLAEYTHRQDRTEAWAVTKSMAIGWGWSFAARFSIGLVMIGLWAIWAW